MTTLPATVTERIDLPAPPSARASDTTDASVSLGDILGIVKRRMLLIILLFVLLSALTVGGWLAAYAYFPLWPAEAFVECISDKPKPAGQLSETTPAQKEYDRFILTQAHSVTSLDVLLEALKTAEVKDTQWYKDTPDKDLVVDFMDLVKAAPQRGTNLLRISVRTRDPEDPHIIVNQVVRQYLNRVKDYNAGEFRDEREVYQRELEKFEEQIVDKNTQITAVGKKLPPGTISTGSNPVAADYQAERATVAQYELMFTELNGLYQIYSQPGGGMSPEDMQFVDLDPKVASLSNQVFTVAQQLAVTRKSLGGNHRNVIELEKLLEVINEQLSEERQQRLAEVLVYKREQVKTATRSAQYSLMKAQERLADTMAHLADMDELLTQYLALQEDLVVLKENREMIASYISELTRIVSERTAVKIEWREQALPPIQRSFPQMFLLPAGITLALVLSVGIALMLEFMDTSLRTPQDFVRHLRIPVLGVVPHVDDEEVDIDRIETAVTDAPQSMYAEVIRTIRTNLQFTATAERQRSIVITSPRPEDGKTSIACNLATMIAQGGRRVLLVDANFRRPAIHRIFKPRSVEGLSNILVGTGKLEDLASRTSNDNLHVLTCGPVPPNPAELMGSSQMVDFIADATGKYDQVIFDAPPVLLASDASVLSTHADGVILVCRAKANTRGVGSRACGLLARVNAHIFGGILNAAEIRRGGYFREQLRTFYDYHLDDEDGYAVNHLALPEPGGDDDTTKQT